MITAIKPRLTFDRFLRECPNEGRYEFIIDILISNLSKENWQATIVIVWEIIEIYRVVAPTKQVLINVIVHRSKAYD